MPFDPRPLVEPVDRTAVTAFARHLRTTGRVASAFGGSLAAIVVVFVVVVFGFVFLTTFISIFGAIVASISAGGGSVWLSLAISIVPMLVVAIALVAIALGVRRLFHGASERWYRLDRFARANGMTYVPQLPAPGLPGMIFNIGDSRASSDLVRGERPRFVEFGNYAYTTGSGKNRTTHQWGYVAVKLDVPLPHIVLDATGNNSLFGSNLPATFDKDQRLSLEGDFDKHFALYCPAGYERDALYLFTPDIMGRFIDNAAALDVEIVDDWLFLYGRRQFSTLDPATWAWLFSVVAALLDKFAQWSRWRDERLRGAGPTMGAGSAESPVRAAAMTDAEAPMGAAATTDAGAPASVPSLAAGAGAMPFTAPLDPLRPPAGVALQGRRLKRGIPWSGIIAAALIVVVWLLGQTGVFGLILGAIFGR